MNIRCCDICGGTSQEALRRQYFLFPGLLQPVYYDVVSCLNCGFTFASSIPDQADLNQFYQSSEHHLHTELPPGLARIHADFFKFIMEHAGLEKNSRILDIGSGMGHFLHHFQMAGFKKLIGMEPSPAAANLARAVYGLEVLGATVDNFNYEYSFNLVTLCGVLEHIADLKSSIIKISDLVLEGGYLFIAVPDVLAFCQKPPSEPFLELALEHINFFSNTSLHNLLVQGGFEQVSTISQHNDFYDNNYILALYRKKSPTDNCLKFDSDSGDALLRYIDYSNHALLPVEEHASQLVRSGEPVIIWGAGSLTSRLLCDTSLGKANIIGIIDRNRNLQGKSLLGVTITAPESIRAYNGATVFIASTTYAKEIKSVLAKEYEWTGRVISLLSEEEV